MNTALLVFVAVVVTLDFLVDLHAARPARRRALERDTARAAVAMSRQLAGTNDDKARNATQMLLDTHPKLKPRTARMLVEGALAELKGK